MLPIMILVTMASMPVILQAWRIVAAQLQKRAEASTRAAAHYRRSLLTSALAHWRVLHLRLGMQGVWARALQVTMGEL